MSFHVVKSLASPGFHLCAFRNCCHQVLHACIHCSVPTTEVSGWSSLSSGDGAFVMWGERLSISFRCLGWVDYAGKYGIGHNRMGFAHAWYTAYLHCTELVHVEIWSSPLWRVKVIFFFTSLYFLDVFLIFPYITFSRVLHLLVGFLEKHNNGVLWYQVSANYLVSTLSMGRYCYS